MYFQGKYKARFLPTPFLVMLLMLFINSSVLAGERLFLEKAIALATANNPSLAAIDARAKALAEIPDQVEALPDPVLSVNLANLPLDSFSFTQEGMTQFQVGIAQALPYPGKLALRSKVAAFNANAARSEVDERRLQLVRDVKTVWWNIYYLDRALQVIARNQVLLEQFVNVAEVRYTVGRGLQQDILLAQLEFTKLSDSAIRINNLRENEVIRLNVLQDKPVTNSIHLPDSVDDSLPTLMTVELLQQQSEAAHPALTAQRERIEAARSRVDLAKKDYAPDFKVGAAYGLRGGSRADLGSIMFSMNLPLYTGSKQDRAVDQRNAEWIQQKYKLHEQHNQISMKVQQAITDYRRSGERTQLFQQEIIPQARQTVDAMLAGYQVGKVDFLNLVRSQTQLYDYETQYWKAFSSANQALARLVAAVGKENVYE